MPVLDTANIEIGMNWIYDAPDGTACTVLYSFDVQHMHGLESATLISMAIGLVLSPPPLRSGNQKPLQISIYEGNSDHTCGPSAIHIIKRR